MKPTKPYLKDKSKRKLEKLKLSLYFVILLLLIYVGSYLIKNTNLLSYFFIKDVRISGVGSFTNLNDLTTISKENSQNKNILTFNTKKLEDLLKGIFLSLKDVKVSKNYPKTLIINVVERSPLAIIKNLAQDAYFLIDEEGYILGEVDPLNLKYPLIIYDKGTPLKIGTFILKPDISIYIEAIKALEKENISISSFKITNFTLEVTLKSQTVVYLPTDKDFSYLSSLLKDVIRKYNMENVVLKKIDLRYDNVIVE